jgi:hypothetical protein
MAPHQQAGHMTASDLVLPITLQKSLHAGGHPHMSHYQDSAMQLANRLAPICPVVMSPMSVASRQFDETEGWHHIAVPGF